jgi:general secretion pathway protein B
MSLILDALRKSEAERRRGRLPGLHAELPPLVHATAPRKRAWPWWFAGLAVLMAAATLAWSQWASRPASASAVPALEATPESVAAFGPARRAASTLPTPAAAPAQAASASGLAAAPSAAERVPAGKPAGVTDAPSTVTADSVAPTSPDLPAPAPSAPRYEPAIANATLPAPAASSSAPTPAIPAPVPSSGSDAVRLADLSPGEREQLPSLKISMHMWGPTPGQRFAIIDGARVGQGDRVGEAVVEEILSDGVVLSWHGRRVSLPLR